MHRGRALKATFCTWSLIGLLGMAGVHSVWAQSPTAACNALSSAVSSGDIDRIRRAVEDGCSPNSLLDGAGATALSWSPNEATTRALLALGADPNKGRFDGGALGPTSFRGDLGSVRALVAAGARADYAGKWNCGPLCEAAGSSTPSVEIMSLLIGAGADVNGSDCWNRTALFTASIAGKADLVAFLLSKGAKVNAYETYQGDTLLGFAAQGGHVAVIDQLLRAGARLDWPNARSCTTPLHVAARRGHLALVKSLLAAGSDPKSTDSAGLTPRGIAAREAQEGVVAYLTTLGTPASGTVRADCVNAGESPEATVAWRTARNRTRAESCNSVTGVAVRSAGAER